LPRERGVSYLVGTPKGRIHKHEKKCLNLPWQQVRDSVQVKLYEQDSELHVLARSDVPRLTRRRLTSMLPKHWTPSVASPQHRRLTYFAFFLVVPFGWSPLFRRRASKVHQRSSDADCCFGTSRNERNGPLGDALFRDVTIVTRMLVAVADGAIMAGPAGPHRR
jgi:hypothetical protein